MMSLNFVNQKHANKSKLKPILKGIVNFPKVVHEVYSCLKSRDILVEVDVDLEEVNSLGYDLYALNASYEDNKWITKLSNLKNDEVLLSWELAKKHFVQSNHITFKRSAVKSPILLKDGSLILSNGGTNNLYKLNSESELVWVNREFRFHHSMNLDHNGDIWACVEGTTQKIDNTSFHYEEALCKIDPNTGEIVYKKSLLDMFLENDLGYVYNYTHGTDLQSHIDDLHHNDVKPVLVDGDLQKKGDLWLSLRHRSMIVQYRPSTEKIIRVIQQDFYNQHNVEIHSDTKISFFNNNISFLYDHERLNKPSFFSLLPHSDSVNEYAEVVVYDLESESFCSLYPNKFEHYQIYTFTQGKHYLLGNGDLFVEEWDTGKVYLFNENEVLLEKYFNRPREDGYVGYPHWVRIYENLDFLDSTIL